MPEFEARSVKVQRFSIRAEHVKKYGMTPGCRGCIAANRGDIARTHSEECRERMMEKIEAAGPEKERERMMKDVERGNAGDDFKIAQQEAKQDKVEWKKVLN